MVALLAVVVQHCHQAEHSLQIAARAFSFPVSPTEILHFAVVSVNHWAWRDFLLIVMR